MKGKKLATKIILGLLLATPYTAFAAQESGSIYQTTEMADSVTVNSDASVTFTNGNTASIGVFAQNGVDIKLTGDEITVNSDAGTHNETRAVWANTNGSITLGNGKSIIAVNATGNSPMAMVAMGTNSKLIVNADTLTVNVDTEYGWGIHAQNNTQTETAPDTAASVNITANNITINSTDLGISAFSNGQMNINGNLVVNADHAIDTRGNATININTDGAHTTVLNGDIVFETPNTPSDPQNSGNLINSNVNINFSGAESSFNGSAYKTYPDSGVEGDYMIDHNDNNHYGNVTDFNLTFDNGAAWNMTNDSFVNDVTLSNGGVINVQENAERFNADEAEMNDGVINLQGDKQEVNVGNLSGESATVNVASENNKMNITTSNSIESLTVSATGNYAEQLVQNNVNESLKNLANQVVDNTATGEGKSAATDLYVAETAVAGAITAEVKDGELQTNTVKEGVNTTNEAISNMANIALMAWRAENNDMNKRLGELRDSKGEHGIWARMVRGEGTYESIKNQYNTYQLGYDEKLGTNPNWTVGAALSYTEGESSFNGGSGENKHTGFAVYGSYLNDDGSFIDLIAKYARLDHDFDVNGGAGSGDYDTNGYSVSAEYGKRFTQDNGMWIEPQVELTYGKIGSANYTTDNGVSVRQDGMDSLVGRIGFALGKDFKQGNAYVRASYLYDFDGETDMTFSKNGVTRGFEQDLGGGWWEVGVGTNINLSDATHLYMDVEKTYGGDVATPWQWNVGVRYSF